MEDELTCRRIIPEVKGGGSNFNSEMAELRRSMANAGVGTAAKVRVSMVPTGILRSPWQPFMDREHNGYLWKKERKKKSHFRAKRLHNLYTKRSIVHLKKY